MRVKIATKNTVAAALAVALASMGLPAAALAANAADETATTAAAAKAAADVLVIGRTDFYWNAGIEDYEGKWFRIDDGDGGGYEGEDSTVMFKYQRNGKTMDLWVDGTGYAGTSFPTSIAMEDWMDNIEYGKWHGTLHVGAGITRIGADAGGKYVGSNVDVEFAKGSELTYLGFGVFEGARSVNLEVCTKLKTMGSFSVSSVTEKVTLPAGVDSIASSALVDTDFELKDPENTSIPSALTGVTVISAPTVKVAGSNKVTVSWAKPYKGKNVVGSNGIGKTVKSYVTYAVKYKVQYRVKGDKTWKKTGYTSSKSKTLTMLTKGKKYQIRVTAYKKSGSSWKALTTSTYKTTSAVKGYNPAPSLKAGKQSITASWSKVPGATSYKVYYRADGTSSWKVKTAKKASAKLSGLADGTKYQVKVRAYKGKSGICESTISTAKTK